MIRLVVVDDQDLVRRGLVTLLNLEDDLEVIGEASNGKEAVDLCPQLKPDVVLMDVQMPGMNGVEATRELLRLMPDLKILVLTTFADDDYIVQLVRAGAAGYLLKNMKPDLLTAAIRAVHGGVSQLDASIAARLAQFVTAPQQTPAVVRVNLSKLSDREVEILKLLGHAMSNKEIAANLHISEGTVRNYVSNILLVLGVNDRTHAAIWALKNLQVD